MEDGGVRFNNSAYGSVTTIWVKDSNSAGTTLGAYLNTLAIGDAIEFKYTDSVFARFIITSNTDSGAYHTFGVTYDIAEGAFSNGNALRMSHDHRGPAGANGVGVPAGGASGQVLAKASATDFDDHWIDPPVSLPLGGTTGQVLAKASNTDLDVTWADGGTGGGSGTPAIYDSVHVYLTTAANSAANTSAKVPYDTVTVDTNSIWDSTNKRVTPKRAGYYMVSMRCRTATAGGLVALIYKNGSQTTAVGTDTASNYASGGSDLVYCNGTTDYIEGWAFSSSARAFTTGTGDTWMSVTGPLLGGSTTGDSFTYFDPDKPPTSPSAYDDEFNGTALDAKWSTVNWTNLSAKDVNTTVPSSLYVHGAATTTVAAALQAIPAGDFCVYAKLAFSGAASGTVNQHLGIALSSTNTTTSSCNYLTSAVYGTQGPYSGFYSSSNWSNTWTQIGIGNGIRCRFLRLRRVGTTYYYGWSEDGKTWFEASTTLAYTPAYFGLFATSPAGTIDGSFEYFRYSSGATATLGGTRTVGYGTDTYSTTETLTNKVWIDGKPIYRKVVNFGALPNTTTKSVAHGVTGATYFTSVTGIAKNAGAGTYLQIPLAWPDANSPVALWCDSTNVYMRTMVNNSTSSGYVILEYTK